MIPPRARLALVSLWLLLGLAASAAEPAGYYDRARGLSGGALKAALHEVIKGHTVTLYADLHPAMIRLHEDPANAANVLLLYSRDSLAKGTNFTTWNREHGWPRSRGNSDQLGADDSDMHYLYPCYSATNSARGNLYYDISDRADAGFRSPAHALAPQTTLDSDSWEPPPGDRGPLARALFYVATRYDGDEANTTDMELVSYVPAGSQMGNLNTLLRWHAEEPVTAAELRRNDLIHSDYQRNRNPFIDHPEWVAAIWGAALANGTGTRPLARVDATVAAAAEQPRSNGQFTIALGQLAPAGGLTVAFRLAGTATAADYVLTSSSSSFTYNTATHTGTLVIAAGAATATVALAPVADLSVEAAEAATLTLDQGVGYTVVPNASARATVAITDNSVLPAFWSFDAGAPYANPLPSEAGNATLSFSAWTGTITNFSGSTGQALALVGAAGNNSSLTFAFSMTGYTGLSVSFQTRGTSTGFSTGTWSWSTDATTFTPLAGVNTATTSTSFSLKTADFSSVTALNGAPSVTLRYTLSGASSDAGNNRIDDLTVRANPSAVAANAAPVITVQPVGVTVASGATAAFAVTASGQPAPSYQWRKNGIALPGETSAILTLLLASAADVATYSCTVANSLATITSAGAALTVTPSTARLANVATRAQVLGGDSILIAGFVINGTQPKDVLVRGSGPALLPFGLSGVLADPVVSLHREDRTLLAQNDDWLPADAATQASVGAFPFPAGSRDAALVVRALPPGSYTAQVSSRATGAAAQGLALVEVYELDTASAPRLVNLSTRAFVGADANILIPGLVITGATSRVVVIRAIGPGLAAFGVGGTLARPELTVFRGATPIATNTGWQSASNLAALTAATANVGAFPLAATSADSALLVALAPGAYTIQVAGADNSTGIALVEVYEVP